MTVNGIKSVQPGRTLKANGNSTKMGIWRRLGPISRQGT